MSRVQESHRNAIADAEFTKAAHALCPNSNTSTTPVLVTTGEDDGTGRLKLTIKDVLKLKRALDKAKVPLDGRRLVLCPDHINDLLELDQRFANQFYQYETGKITNMKGLGDKEVTIRLREIGVDGIKKKITDLNKLLSSPSTSAEQAKNIKAQISEWGNYEARLRKSQITFTKTWGDIRSIGDGVKSLTTTLKGNGSA